MCSSQTTSLPCDEASYKQLQLYFCFGILDYKEYYSMADRVASQTLLRSFTSLDAFSSTSISSYHFLLVTSRLVRAFHGRQCKYSPRVVLLPSICSEICCYIRVHHWAGQEQEGEEQGVGG